MTTNLEITGNTRDRFVQAAALLYLLDHVRGEPTVYGLDQDAPNLQVPKERVLKRKFLDSFALICATRQGGDAVSAACLEEGEPEGTVVRIASNAGVSEETLSQLNNILGLLSSVSNEGMLSGSPSRETEMLAKIIQLDITKIRKYIRNLQKSNGVFEESIASLESRLVEALPDRALPAIQQFLEWFKWIQLFQDLSLELGPSILLSLVRWAQKAKKVYRDLLTLAFSKGDQPLPRWVHIVFKLGRYGIAAKAMIRTAIDLPALFNPIFVKSIGAPPIVKFHQDEDMPLSCVLRRIAEIRPTEIILRLAKIWDTDDPESFFRKSCPANLVAHAECQLINFYDHHPEQMPRFQFIGVSKKSCYLCSVFLATHPGGFCVSSCHQKLYPSWILPPALDAKIYRRYKGITAEMSKKMEVIAKQDLVRRLGSKRSPIPADSTAGVSITGLTESRSLEVTDFEEYDESYVEVQVNTETGQPDSTSHSRIDNSHVPFSDCEPDATYFGFAAGSVNKVDISGRQFKWQDSQVSLSSMVFHFKYPGSSKRQDIIMIGSVLDPRTHTPSWSKLIELLNEEKGIGHAFQGSDILIINKHIHVRNERQFIACLQYLLNSGVLNSEVMICDKSSLL